MLDQIRNLDVDRLQLPEALELHAVGSATLESFKRFEVDPPGWLANGIETLEVEIRRARRDMLSKKLADANARVETYKSQKQKRMDAEAEIARITALLQE